MRVLLVAHNELAIVTKSIAFALSPRRADAVGSLLRGERRYGRDAFSNTSSECVVAKANEADCGAQTPKSKHVRKGESAIRVHVVQLLYRKNLHLFRVFL